MKRIVCLLLAILMVFGSVAVLASCGECTEHVDANHDGKCDNDGCEATVTVTHVDENADENGFLSASALSGKDDMQITVSGNNERILLVAMYDNLGKGASGAAVECMNYVLGVAPETGLEL